MRSFHLLRGLPADQRGSAIVEFAILGPVVVAMLMGVLWVGLQMQKYNALRSIAADVNRYTVVEYQKDNKLSAEQIEYVAKAISVKSPYTLTGDELDVNVTPESSPIDGASAFLLNISYTPHNYLDFWGVSPVNMSFSQNIYVPD